MAYVISASTSPETAGRDFSVRVHLRGAFSRNAAETAHKMVISSMVGLPIATGTITSQEPILGRGRGPRIPAQRSTFRWPNCRRPPPNGLFRAIAIWAGDLSTPSDSMLTCTVIVYGHILLPKRGGQN